MHTMSTQNIIKQQTQTLWYDAVQYNTTALMCTNKLNNKKVSYCKQIMHQLCTQYVDGIYSNTVTFKSRLRVTQSH